MTTAAHDGVYLSDLLDRLLTVGIVLRGSLVLSVADVELVYIDLAALISSFHTAFPEQVA